MRDRELPGTALRLTEIGFGAASLGNLYVASTDEEAEAAVDEAWLKGIRYFDTAPHYGLGLSERRLGSALRKYPREDLVISTKVGRLLVPRREPRARDDDLFVVPGDFDRMWDFSRDGILRSVEGSLERLGTDHIDILYLHDPDESHVADAAFEGGAALVELRDEGVVTAVGVGSNSARVVAELFDRTDIDTAMLAGRYTLLERRGADAVFEAAGNRRIVAAGVFNSGLLATERPTSTATYNYTTAPPDVLARAHRLADVAEEHGGSLPQAAVAFPLRNRQVASVVLGMRTYREVRRNVTLADAELPSEFWDAVQAEPADDPQPTE